MEGSGVVIEVMVTVAALGVPSRTVAAGGPQVPESPQGPNGLDSDSANVAVPSVLLLSIIGTVKLAAARRVPDSREGGKD